MFGQPEPLVVIAGDGVAASAAACRLLDTGFGVALLAGRHRAVGGPAVLEALPEATARLLGEVGLGGALAAAGAVAVEGFENAYRRMDGIWLHVDRRRLARTCLTEARRRGATLVPRGTVNRPHDLGAFAVVDATGRAARWSRPVSRSGTGVAVLFAGPCATPSPRPGRIAHTADGWAYRLDHPDGTTVGVVAGAASSGVLTDELAAQLGIDDPSALARVGSQPAFVQWSRHCAGPGPQVAIGDAALAYNPVAGQGVRFAVSSALAASAVITSWREDGTCATDYYRSFVDGARERHLAKLASLDDAPQHSPLDLRRGMRFVAAVRRVPMNVGGRIVIDEGCVLADGGLVRWVGGLDVLQVRDAIGGRSTGSGVKAVLVAGGVPEAAADVLLAWALRVGLVAYEP